MIDPKLLTKENGFEDGVVVEIVWLNEADHEFIVWDEIEKHNVCDDDLLSELLSIRPLTGPMAIWNFAPNGAVACLVDVTGIKWIYADNYRHADLITRPFWAKRREE